MTCKSHKSAAMILFAISAALSGGCAPMSEAQRDYRDQQLELYRAQFVRDKQTCLAQGGRIFVLGFGVNLDRDGVPRSRARYECT